MKTIVVCVAPTELCFIPLFKTMLLLIVAIKAPMATLIAIVINSLLTKEYAVFLNVSVFSVHTENGSFND